MVEFVIMVMELIMCGVYVESLCGVGVGSECAECMWGVDV